MFIGFCSLFMPFYILSAGLLHQLASPAVKAEPAIPVYLLSDKFTRRETLGVERRVSFLL